MTYIPPSGDSIGLDFSGSYIPPDGGIIIFAFGETEPLPVEPSVPMSVDCRSIWGSAKREDKRSRSAWAVSNHVPRAVRIANHDAISRPRQWAARWDLMAKQAAHAALPWARLDPVGLDARGGWGGTKAFDLAARLAWDHSITAYNVDVSAPYLYPPRQEYAVIAVWDGSIHPSEVTLTAEWHYPPPIDEHLMSQWGDQIYQRICRQEYRPPSGNAVALNLHKPLQQAGLDFVFSKNTYDIRCSQQHPGGWRDAYPSFEVPQGAPKNQILEVYIIVNTVSVVKLPERTPVEVGNLSLGLDVDSWSWRISAQVFGAASLALIRPDAAGVREIEVTINGYVWEFVVEEYSQSREFKGAAHNITGRSKTAYLADPYQAPVSYVESSLKTAQQLAEQEVTPLGWTVNWYTVGWNVLAGAYYYNSKTPIQAVSMIAGAVGATVRPHRSALQIDINPRYPVSPWNWSAQTPAAIITHDVIKKIGGSWSPKPAYNGVYVSGESLGVSCFVKRAGTDGALLAPEVVDTLITHQDAGRERGRNILADQGKQEIMTIDTPLMPSPGVPGLFNIGELLEIDEGAAGVWRGQVMGVDIRATRNQKSLTVHQSITIERHHA